MDMSLQVQMTSELKMGFHILLLGFGQKLGWEVAFQPTLCWEMGFGTPLHDPLRKLTKQVLLTRVIDSSWSLSVLSF